VPGEPPDQSVGAVVGEAVRQLRDQRQHSQEELALYCQLVGLDWTRDTIASLETGRKSDVSLGELMLLAGLFDVPVADLFSRGAAQIVLGESGAARQTTSREALRQWLSRLSKVGEVGARILSTDERQRALRRTFALDLRLAEHYGIAIEEMPALAEKLWGRSSATEARAHRVAERQVEAAGGDPVRAHHHPPLNPSALRGNVTRQLMREIEQELQRRRTEGNEDGSQQRPGD
jgi:transcriptional regulator with XRE-family HTH domain